MHFSVLNLLLFFLLVNSFPGFSQNFFSCHTLFKKIILCKSEKCSILTSKMREIIALLCCVKKSSAKKMLVFKQLRTCYLNELLKEELNKF
jgi:hypothetical protein